jgi:spore germination protein YaaH
MTVDGTGVDTPEAITPIEPVGRDRPAVRIPRPARLAVPAVVAIILAVALVRSVAVPGGDPSSPGAGAAAATAPASPGASLGAAALATPDPTPGPVLGIADAPLPLTREVFGFLPYWKMDAKTVAGLRYDSLSTLALFGIGIGRSGALNTKANGYRAYTGATAAKITDAAHAKGVRVVPTFQLFDSKSELPTMKAFLASDAAQKKFIAAAIALMKERKADGAVLDFEPLPESLAGQFATFAAAFRDAIHAKDKKAHLTVALHQAATDTTIATIAPAVDRIFVMAYDYHWLGSPSAGAVAPLDGPGGDVRLTLLRFIEGAGRAKVILGVPYFGYDWPIAFKGPGATVRTPAKTYGGVWSVGYSAVLDFLRKHPSIKVHWDPTAASPYFTYHDTKKDTDRQAWYESSRSLAAKYALAKAAGIAGVGVWTLGMDTGRSELWTLLRTSFGKMR